MAEMIGSSVIGVSVRRLAVESFGVQILTSVHPFLVFTASQDEMSSLRGLNTSSPSHSASPSFFGHASPLLAHQPAFAACQLTSCWGLVCAVAWSSQSAAGSMVTDLDRERALEEKEAAIWRQRKAISNISCEWMGRTTQVCSRRSKRQTTLTPSPHLLHVLLLQSSKVTSKPMREFGLLLVDCCKKWNVARRVSMEWRKVGDSSRENPVILWLMYCNFERINFILIVLHTRLLHHRLGSLRTDRGEYEVERRWNL